MNIINYVDDRQDVLSETLSFCGESYLLTGCVSKKWNQVYKMRNTTMTTAASQCTTIDSMEQFIKNSSYEWSENTMDILFKTARKFRASNQEEMMKAIFIKNIFIHDFRWTDRDLIQFTRECLNLKNTSNLITQSNMTIMEKIVDNANRLNQESVMFDILEMYYTKFPQKRGENVFTFNIARYRTLAILNKYVDRYEFGEFDHCIIKSTRRQDIIESVDSIKKKKRGVL